VERTADLSTTLRCGRDDKSVEGATIVDLSKSLVISTGAKRSGEICGSFPDYASIKPAVTVR
jgi:hypothetical protein